jgi:hypothetical protein
VTASSPGVGNTPYSVVAADVNGDGKVDLISANTGANTLTVLTNNGSGGFTLASSPGSGGAGMVVAADVNRDGKVDLVGVILGSPGSLLVLTNNGSGGFGSNATLSVGIFPRWLTTADVNGDGAVDLISANQTPSTLSVLTNNGSGGFTLASSPSTGDFTFPFSVTAADVNGDGKVDLITANGISSGTLSVLTNDGSGGFALALSPVVGSFPHSVTAADVNGDGKVDLIGANQTGNSGNTLSVLVNAPTLTSTRSNNSVVVSWPSPWIGWKLLQNTNLATTNWSASLDSTSSDGTNRSLTIPSPAGNLFFRLSYP